MYDTIRKHGKVSYVAAQKESPDLVWRKVYSMMGGGGGNTLNTLILAKCCFMVENLTRLKSLHHLQYMEYSFCRIIFLKNLMVWFVALATPPDGSVFIKPLPLVSTTSSRCFEQQ